MSVRPSVVRELWKNGGLDELPFGIVDRVGPANHVSDGGSDPTQDVANIWEKLCGAM